VFPECLTTATCFDSGSIPLALPASVWARDARRVDSMSIEARRDTVPIYISRRCYPGRYHSHGKQWGETGGRHRLIKRYLSFVSTNVSTPDFCDRSICIRSTAIIAMMLRADVVNIHFSIVSPRDPTSRLTVDIELYMRLGNSMLTEHWPMLMPWIIDVSVTY